MTDTELNPADEIIVEHLRESVRDTPANMANEHEYDRIYINQRCGKLTESGILVNHGNGVYGLADDTTDETHD